jgi:hypothetical protein
VFPKKIEKLQPEKRREIFSGLQTFLSLVSTVNLQDFLNFDDFKCTNPCNFTGGTEDRKVLSHKNDRIMFLLTYMQTILKIEKLGKAETL